MKTHLYILFIITLFCGCGNNRTKEIKCSNPTLEVEQTNVQQNDSNVSKINNDTLYQDFDRIIREKAAQWNVKFEVEELDSTKIFAPIDESEETGYIIREYLYYIDNDNYTKFNLNIIETPSDIDAYRLIQEMKQEAVSMEPFKIIFHSFRIFNKVYSFRCTSNISHIRLEISKNIFQKYKISDDNIVEI